MMLVEVLDALKSGRKMDNTCLKGVNTIDDKVVRVHYFEWVDGRVYEFFLTDTEEWCNSCREDVFIKDFEGVENEIADGWVERN